MDNIDKLIAAHKQFMQAYEPFRRNFKLIHIYDELTMAADALDEVPAEMQQKIDDLEQVIDDLNLWD